jgi:uncharacterized protein YgiM (DUF1202 family)
MRLTVVLFVLIVAVNAMAVTATGSGEPVCAKNFTVLRKGPGTTFPISWRVSRYMPFFRYETKNGWVRVTDLDGESHWAQPRDLTTSIHCVVVRANVATLRREPSVNAPTIDIKSVDKFTPLKKIEVNGEWVKVEDETGRTAWIHESNIWKPAKVQAVKF